ncbi:MAG: hypothetical protein MJ154_01130 [Candidatus Saccharibacteria bacterium]|nr:hypothetical protein [Candidatus Saccharibacteria bacterium]
MSKEKKSSSKPDYNFVSELTYHYYPDEDGIQLTERQAKIFVACIAILFVGVMAFALFFQDNSETVYGDQIPNQELQLNSLHTDLITEADKLCSVRIDYYTYDDVIEADDFIASYKFTKSDKVWTGANGSLSFSDNVISFTPTGSETTLSYICEAGNDYYIKFEKGVQSFSTNDMKALGRVLAGVYDDFH